MQPDNAAPRSTGQMDQMYQAHMVATGGKAAAGLHHWGEAPGWPILARLIWALMRRAH